MIDMHPMIKKGIKDMRSNIENTAKLYQIYSPQGIEFASLAYNPWVGCPNRCSYCRVPDQFQTKDEDFLSPQLENDIIRKLEADLRLIISNPNISAKRGGEWANISMPVLPILIMIAGDLYYPPNGKLHISRKILELFKNYKVPFDILTIGGTKAVEDFDLYFEGCLFGGTLTFDNDIDSLRYEPGAALPMDRIDALKQAHSKNIQTWVLLEPVVDPAQTLKLIELTYPFVDKYWVGMTIHDGFISEYWASKTDDAIKLEKSIDWHKFRTDAEALLQKFGCDYEITRELTEATSSLT